MNLFCREAAAHLELHPHAAGATPGPGSSAPGVKPELITPELWLKDCGSPDQDLDAEPDEDDPEPRSPAGSGSPAPPAASPPCSEPPADPTAPTAPPPRSPALSPAALTPAPPAHAASKSSRRSVHYHREDSYFDCFSIN